METQGHFKGPDCYGDGDISWRGKNLFEDRVFGHVV